jgi:hypothetical protein
MRFTTSISTEPRAMRGERPQDGWRDHAERRSQRHVHANVFRNADDAEHFIEYRHEHATAADAEQPGKKAACEPRRHKQQKQTGKLFDRYRPGHQAASRGARLVISIEPEFRQLHGHLQDIGSRRGARRLFAEKTAESLAARPAVIKSEDVPRDIR